MVWFRCICPVFVFFLCGSPSAQSQEFYIVNGPNTVTTNLDGSVRVYFRIEHLREVSYGDYTDEEFLLGLLSGIPEGTPIQDTPQGLQECDDYPNATGLKNLPASIRWWLHFLLQFPIL
jgi:hypothetical protein